MDIDGVVVAVIVPGIACPDVRVDDLTIAGPIVSLRRVGPTGGDSELIFGNRGQSIGGGKVISRTWR